MIKIFNLVGVFASLISLSSCAQKTQHISIRQFIPKEQIYLNKDDGRVEYFIVSNYIDNNSNDSVIANFANSNKNIEWEKYKSYQMMFFKETKYTNEKKLLANPRSLDRYSQKEDWIFLFVWTSGKFEGKYKIDKGKVISPSSIKIED